MKDPKPKKCKDCSKEFNPFKFAQPRCVPCAILKGRADTKKQMEKKKSDSIKSFNKETKKRKAAIKGKSEFKKEAQAAFNSFIRERDKELACISCGRNSKKKVLRGAVFHAGHYRSRGANPELSFVEDNVHKQCAYCNKDLSGNVTNYRINLIKKIGAKRLEWLEGPHELTRYSNLTRSAPVSASNFSSSFISFGEIFLGWSVWILTPLTRSFPNLTLLST